jgi:hypothetical protein
MFCKHIRIEKIEGMSRNLMLICCILLLQCNCCKARCKRAARTSALQTRMRSNLLHFATAM